MPALEYLLRDDLLPALLALALLAWAWRKREVAPKSSEPARCAGAWAFGLALVLAQRLIFGELVLPWEERVLAAKDWLPTCLVAGALLSTLALVPRVHVLLPRGGAGLVLALLVLLSLRARMHGPGGSLEALAVFAFVLLTWSSLELSCERLRGPSPCLLLACTAALTGLTLLGAGSSGMARLLGALAALFTAAAVVAWRRRVFTLSGGPTAAASLVLASAWINGWAYGELQLDSTLCSCAAFVVPSYAGIGPLATWPAPRRELARWALALLLAGTAVWLAWPRSWPSFSG